MEATMSASDMHVLNDTPHTIPLHAIERTVHQLWRESVDTDADRGVVQVRTLNLVVFVPESDFTSEVQQSIAHVAVQHPGRTIVLVASAGDAPPQADVTIACRLGDGGKQICGELITLHSGDGGMPLPSTAASLLVAGLPVFVWWVGDPTFSRPIFEALTDQADRVIVDARTWHAPHATLHDLAEAVQQMPKLAFTDLQWTALTPWRRMIAQCFDLPDSQPQLQRLQQINITHGPDASDRLGALLLLGWLGSRLGWQVEPRSPLQVRRADGTPLAVTLQQAAHDGMEAVELRSADATFAIIRRDGSECAEMHITLPTIVPMIRIGQCKAPSLATLVSEELMVLDRDDGYEAALHVAAQLLQAQVGT
jgi:glucose-6-phosphate dehydrogenase assembly protein OpcA